MAPKQRAQYTPGQLTAAVDEVLSGKAAQLVEAETAIPYSTLRKYANAREHGRVIEQQRRGPKPLLPLEAESNIFDWVVGRQQVGYPVERGEIIRKATAIAELLYDRGLGAGWYKRFMERHPMLTNRVSQSLTKTRNNVNEEDVRILSQTLLKLNAEQRLDGSRTFNMDETAFQSRKKNKNVVALRGSKNVWNTEVGANFHLTIVACDSAAGFVVPPLFILPGKTVHVDLLTECGIPGSSVTTTETGFMNTGLFTRWLTLFACSVPSPIRRPIVLIMDGCSSHYSPEVLKVATSLQILLVCLPANATHLYQPLDVAVFSAFKRKLREFLNQVQGDTGAFTIDKFAALRVVGLAWSTCNFEINIQAGFRACGLYPLSSSRMFECLSNFKQNGAGDVKLATWLKYKDTVQDDILVLPAPRKKSRHQQRIQHRPRGVNRQRHRLLRTRNHVRGALNTPH